MGDLTGPGEKMFLDEPIAIGKKDPEIGVRVVPADDRQVRELRVHLGVDLGPGLVGEGHFGESGLGPFTPDRLDDLDERADLVTMPGPDQDAADLHRSVRRRVLPECIVDLGSEENAKTLVAPTRKRLLR